MKRKSSSGLCPEAQKFIDDLRKLLTEQKILTSLDDATMNLLANTYHTYIKASQILSEKGLLITSPRGELKAHPCVKIALDAQIQMDKLYDKLGMNPKARREQAKPKEKEKSESDIAKFIKSQKKVNVAVQNN
jgi:P27 family predicted phage terminase small subunit